MRTSHGRASEPCGVLREHCPDAPGLQARSVDSRPRSTEARHAPCTHRRPVGTDAKLRLAIRTVAVTTRVAVKSHEKHGNGRLAAASAQRGLVLLDQLAEALDDGASTEARDAFEAARSELSALAERAEAGMTSFSIGADDSSIQKDIDIGPKLRS